MFSQTRDGKGISYFDWCDNAKARLEADMPKGTVGYSLQSGSISPVSFKCPSPPPPLECERASSFDRWNQTECEKCREHVCAGDEIERPLSLEPSVVGAHRPLWAKWGTYHYIPPDRYLHNLEHGGLVFLHRPCDLNTSAQLESAALLLARRHALEGKVIITPMINLTHRFAALLWGFGFASNCTPSQHLERISDFYQETSGYAPEDESSSGPYDFGWRHDVFTSPQSKRSPNGFSVETILDMGNKDDIMYTSYLATFTVFVFTVIVALLYNCKAKPFQD